MTTVSAMTLTLVEFLTARIDEDEAAARAVPPLGHNYDMGGNRQVERFTFGRTLPSSADGMGNWSPHRGSPTTQEHFARYDPARVLREVEAKRRIVERHNPCDDWSYGDPSGCPDLRDLASVDSDHPDWREEWRP